MEGDGEILLIESSLGDLASFRPSSVATGHSRRRQFEILTASGSLLHPILLHLLFLIHDIQSQYFLLFLEIQQSITGLELLTR